MHRIGKIILIAAVSLSCTSGALMAAPEVPAATPTVDASAVPAALPGEPVDLKAIDAIVDKALAAFNSGDFKAFYADYSKSMSAVATEQAFKTLYVDMYMNTYGKYQSRTLLKDQSVLIPENPMPLAVFEGVFEKNPKVKISVNFAKEEGGLKVIQIQFNPM